MLNIQLSTEDLKAIHERLLNDKAYQELNNKIADVYNKAMPFCVITDDGEKYLDYKPEVKELVSKIEEMRRMYLEQNYPDLVVPF